MRANKLFEAIYSRKIKENSKINVICNYNVVDTITYKNNTLCGKNGGFSSKYFCDIETEFEVIKEQEVTTHHITIETDKLKELILEVHKNYWHDYTLKAKIEAVKRYAEFDNDTELLEFLEFMEE